MKIIQDVKDPKLELDVKWKIIENLYSDPFYLQGAGISCLKGNQFDDTCILVEENNYKNIQENKIQDNEIEQKHIPLDFIEMLSNQAQELSNFSRLRNSNGLDNTPNFKKNTKENLNERLIQTQKENKLSDTLFEITEESND